MSRGHVARAARTFLPLRSASVMSPTDFLAISTTDERATFDCDMRDGMAPLNEAEAAENETAAESIVG